ncbi:protein DpdJ [Thermopolyspora sp. NPDC052614]|uniref:protein DpdJ n=1 Tax=Thermopolyspora sp. NPDC052614 TaxID=3155682 RepID=UPI00341B8CCD
MTGQAPTKDIIPVILDALEDLELPLLSWGVTSVELSDQEVRDTIERHAQGQIDTQKALSILVTRGLLLKIPGSSPPTYRTRLAETVRLAAGLRQLFAPKDLANPPARWWSQGKKLVADYRLLVSPRRYPKRNIPPDKVLSELGTLRRWGSLQSAVANAQIQGRPLSRFQVAATRAIFEAAGDDRSRGIIVGAGTGSGKTMAFYLPAFCLMAEQARRGNDRGVQTLALYPRTELLRDQMKDAVAVALQVNKVLKKGGLRTLRIGALYGDVPQDHNFKHLKHMAKAWRPGPNGSTICPYLPCPECGADLVWPEAERRKEIELLACIKCPVKLDKSVIALTRKSLQESPPDLLFTTTEMLHRNATDRAMGTLLGWYGRKPPRLVLFDEVHTYSGTHGAQVALMVRRWRHRTGSQATFVGLSATLRDAGRFFSQLTGLEESTVDYIEPQFDEMEAEGREYAIALRGDPVSGADLLSTSIQTAMLFGRVMDVPGNEYLYGSKGFLFTDALDVANRFYDNLRDAEGGQYRAGRYRRQTKPVLAALRSSSAPQADERFRDAQAWHLVERIGRSLPPEADDGWLTVTRTSSQDSGVNPNADLIVATASLEVGFNDPTVGFILQHKSPHDPAAFIQRRGRAGRDRRTRPWSVVTLSDYGRDRLAYQAYDSLFNPELQARSLAIGNRFILKMQATHALLDWLGEQLATEGSNADPRKLLTAPRERPRNLPVNEKKLLDILQKVLRDPQYRDGLASHLQDALSIDEEEVRAVLWDQPRSLMLAVIPTAIRRLLSNWTPLIRDPGAKPGDMLPEFVTRTLFQQLNVPEVVMKLPFEWDEDEETLTIEQALREAVPGKVSRRYGYRRDSDRTWLPIPQTGDTLDVATIAPEYASLGQWQIDGGTPVDVVQPFSLQLDKPSPEVRDSAQGFPIWASQFLPAESLDEADVPAWWQSKVVGMAFATHANGAPLEARRMTTGAQVETSFKNGKTQNRRVRYVLDGNPAALGFSLAVDAVRFDLAPLDLDNPEVCRYLSSPSWRSLAFTTSLAEDTELDGIVNTFQRGWLSLVYLAAFALRGLDGSATGRQIHASLANGAWSGDLDEVLKVLYREPEINGTSVAPERLVSALTELGHNPKVRERLDKHGELLVEPDIRDRTSTLAHRVYHETMAAALLAATQRACPDAHDRDLIADVLATDNDCATVWLSETSMGGLGVIEQLARYYSADPRRFWGLVSNALTPTDYEYVDATVTALLVEVTEHPAGAAASAVQDIRRASASHETQRALSELRAAWSKLTGPPRHAAVAALSTRLLRPGSTSATDHTALGLIKAWTALEDRLGFEIDARVLAFAVGSKRLQVPGAQQTLSSDQAFSLLWPRGAQARRQKLDHYQPYSGSPVLDRLLAVAALDERHPEISVMEEEWQERYREGITSSQVVYLVTPAENGKELAAAIRRTLAFQIDVGTLPAFGTLRSFINDGQQVRARIELEQIGDEATGPFERMLHVAAGSTEAIDALLRGVICAELISPSDQVLLECPALDDMLVLDNQSGNFDDVFPDANPQVLTLTEALAMATGRGTQVAIITRPGERSDAFLERVYRYADASRLKVHKRDDVYGTTFCGDEWVLTGPLNAVVRDAGTDRGPTSYRVDAAASSHTLISKRKEIEDA